MKHKNDNAKLGRRDFLRAAAAGASAAALPAWARAAKTGAAGTRPNFVIIMADDIGPDHYGCYGSRKDKTPNIDKLARTGVMFRTCWATPMCAPSRTLIATGRYAHRTGVWHNGLKIQKGKVHPGRFASEHVTFARALKAHGYATAMAGNSMMIGGRLGSPQLGFDEHCYHHGAAKLPDGTTFKGLYEGRYRLPGSKPVTSRYWHPCVVRNGKPVPTGPKDFGPDVFTDFAIDFIRRHKDRPFLVYYPMKLTHGIAGGGLPTTPPRGRPGKLRGGNLKECNEYVDLLVGKIVRALEEMNLRDRTIVFFTSDNADAGAGKTWATERGARVPMVINCPGIVKARGPTDELTDFADILPTLVEFAGAKLANGYEIDGKSLAPFLRGRTDRHREWIFSYIGTARMLRDKRWLLEGADAISGIPHGRLYDCGNSRNGGDYKDVTDSKDPGVVAARRRFSKILSKLPAPDPNDPATKKALERYSRTPFRHKLRGARARPGRRSPTRPKQSGRK